jgi:hypothetical protein
MNQADWLAADGSTGITSASIMDAADTAGRALEVGSNFFLFFSSRMSDHAHMNAGRPPSRDPRNRQRLKTIMPSIWR